MSVSSLSRMTVPLASDQSANAQGLLMPKLKYRFRVVFDNFGVSTPRTELTKQVIDFTRPTVSFEEVPIELYNSRMYLAGKHTWEIVTVNLRDDAGGNVTRLVGEQLQRQLDFMEQVSASAGIDYKFLTRCEMLDGGNGATEPVVLETNCSFLGKSRLSSTYKEISTTSLFRMGNIFGSDQTLFSIFLQFTQA